MKIYTFNQKRVILIFCVLLMSLFRISAAYGQQVYATSQNNSITPVLCTLCAISNPQNAVDANQANYTSLNAALGLLNGSVQETLVFPHANTNAGCDSLVLLIANPSGLLSVNLLGSVSASTANGGVSNADKVSLNSPLITLLTPSGPAQKIVIYPTQTFDRVTISINAGLAGLLNSVNLYGAYYSKTILAAPLITTPAVSICSGGTATLEATAQTGSTIAWYTGAAGGTMVGTGASLSVNPTQTTTYYAQANLGSCSSVTRTMATVTVNPLPAAPVAAVSSISIFTGQTANLSVQSADPSLTYNWYTSATGGTSIASGSIYQTPTLAANATYYIGATSASGCQSATRTAVTVNVSNSNPNSSAACYQANNQSQAINGLCLLCSISNPQNASDGDTTTHSTISVPVGLLGGYAQQTLTLSSAGKAGDSIRILGGFPSALLSLNLLSTVQILSFNGGISNNDALVLNSSLVKISLLSGSTKFVATFVAKADFDQIQISLNSGVAGALSTLYLYDVQRLIPGATFTSSTIHTCSGVPVNLAVNAVTGTSYNLYTSATGGVPLSSGTSLSIPGLKNSAKYYVSTIRNGCENPVRTAVSIIVDSLPSIPVAASASVTVCSGSPATVIAHASSSGANIHYYTTPTGGTAVGSGDTLITGAITTPVIYYAESQNATGCTNPLRTAITVNPASAPVTPVSSATIVHACAGSSANLNATSTTPGAVIYWYANVSGGAALGAGNSFQTPAITSSTTFYAAASVGTCSSARLPIQVNVTNPPAAPVVAISPSTPLAAGTSATLTASPAAVNTVFKWYANQGDTNPIFTGNPFVTPGLSATTNYYVESSDTLSGCTSPRTTVNIPVNSVFNTSCDFANSQSSNVNGLCIGCSVTNSSSVADADTTNYTTLNVVAGLLGAYVQQTIKFPSLSEPGDSIHLVMEFPSTVLSASLLGSIQIASFNGTVNNNDSIAVNNPAIKLTLLGTTGKFMISFMPGKPFDGIRIRLNSGALTALTQLEIFYGTKEIPAPVPQATSISVCVGTKATISLNPQANSTFQFFTSANGGSLLGAGTSLTTGVLNASTTIYAQAQRTSSGCINPGRIAIQINVLPLPVLPVISPATYNLCAGQTLTLQATVASGNTVSWYDAVAGGNLLGTGTSFTTSPLTSNTTFYAEASNGACTTSSRVPVQVNVSPTPLAPVLNQSTLNICAGASASLAVQPVNGLSYNWYSQISGGTVVSSGTTFKTPALTNSAVYYVEAVDSNSSCKNPSVRSLVQINVNPVPAAPTVAADSIAICWGRTASFTATSSDQNVQLQWFATATSTDVLYTGSTFTTPPLYASTSYYVAAMNDGGCSSGSRTSVYASVSAGLPIPVITATDTALCAGGSSTLTASVTGQNVTVNWYDQPSQGNLIATGTSLVTGPLTTTTSYYAESSNATCTSGRSRVVIQVGNYAPVPVVANGALTVCQGSSATLQVNAQAGAFYNWYTNANADTLVGSGASFVTPPLTHSRSYYVRSFNPNSPCQKGSVVVADSITVTPKVPDAQIDMSNLTVCSGSSTTLTASSPLAGTIFNWYSSATNTTPIYTGNTFVTPNLTATTDYFIQGTNPGYCPGTMTLIEVHIESVLPVPVVTASSSTTSSATFRWASVEGASGYDVTTDGGKTFVSLPDSVTSYTVGNLTIGSTATIQVRAKGTVSCANSTLSLPVSITITNTPQGGPSNVWVPNAFTPNSDGKNDVFMVYGENIASLQFMVYNQWGQMIFHSSDQSLGWDGTFRGIKQPEGVYVYMLEANLQSGTHISKKGSITLIR